MRMRKRNCADALYAGPDVTVEEVLDLFWSGEGSLQYVPNDDRFRFHVHPTKSGNQLFIPVLRLSGAPDQDLVVNPKIYVADKPCQWPILPVHKYRGGYMTATARAAVEWGQCIYRTPDFKVVERKGKYVRTRHRVVYADRIFDVLVVDTLIRPETEDAS